MNQQNGVKIGWLAGWCGGFIWVFILSIVFLFQGKFFFGMAGLVLTGLAVFSIFYSAPWKHPSTPYWKLMIPVYNFFLASIIWAVWSYGGLKVSGLKWWDFFWLLPILTPLFTIGKRTWESIAAPRAPEEKISSPAAESLNTTADDPNLDKD
jgi:hypothetical protein